MKLAILVAESANRVYASAAAELALAELDAIAPSLHVEVGSSAERTLGGVEYVVLEATRPRADGLDDHDRFVLSNLSSTRALFELRDDVLVPLDLEPLAWFDDDLLTIQRYPGKTNERFTHLLVNVALAESSAAHERAADGLPVRLLDPVAGRGTTLNRALVYGFDAAGVETALADVERYQSFLLTYLREHRVKHRRSSERVRKGPLAGITRVRVQVRGHQSVEVVRGDAERADELFARSSFDVIIGDLPYGVQHRAAAGSATARSPLELLQAALDPWRTVLRGGGSIGLSWNLRTLRRDEVLAALEHHGFTPVQHPRSFEHVVDRSITRDLVVARRT